MDDSPAINGWAIIKEGWTITKGTHSPAQLNKRQSDLTIRESSPAIYGWVSSAKAESSPAGTKENELLQPGHSDHLGFAKAPGMSQDQVPAHSLRAS